MFYGTRRFIIVYNSPPLVPILSQINPASGIPSFIINPLNAELNPIRHLLALVGPRHIVHVSRIRVNVHFNPSIYGYVSQAVTFLQVSQSKLCNISSIRATCQVLTTHYIQKIWVPLSFQSQTVKHVMLFAFLDMKWVAFPLQETPLSVPWYRYYGIRWFITVSI